MKKFFAVLLSLVMTVSLFSGVAFASTPHTYFLQANIHGTVALNQIIFISGSLSRVGSQTLVDSAYPGGETFQVLLQRRDLTATTWAGATTFQTILPDPNSGVFNIAVNLNSVGTYRLVAVRNGAIIVQAGADLAQAVGTVSASALTVTPGITETTWSVTPETVRIPLTVTRPGATAGTVTHLTTGLTATFTYGGVVATDVTSTVSGNTVTFVVPRPAGTPATGVIGISVSHESGNWVGSAAVNVVARAPFNVLVTPVPALAVGTPSLLTVQAFDALGNFAGGGSTTFAYTITTVTGPFAAPAVALRTTDAALNFTVTPRHGGVITVTVLFYDAAHNIVSTQVRTLTVPGITVSIPVTAARRLDVATLRAIVTDAAGNRVNNARVTFTGTAGMFATRNAAGTFVNTADAALVVNGMAATQPTGSAVVNGEFSIDVTLRTLGNISVLVEIPTLNLVTNMIEWTAQGNWGSAIAVTGNLGYTLALTHTLLAGATAPETVSVTVRDAAGVAITSGLTFTGPTALTVGPAIHVGLGVWSVPLHVVGAAGTFTLTAANADSTTLGTASIVAVAPVVAVTPAGGRLTANFRDTITVTVTDPRTNVAVARNITVAARNVTAPNNAVHATATIISNEMSGTVTTAWVPYVVAAASAQQFRILASPTAAATRTVAGVVSAPQVSITVAGAPAVHLTLTDATLVVTPTTLVQGVRATISVTVNNAHGTPIPGRFVTLSGRMTTDAAGVAIPAAGTLSIIGVPAAQADGVVTAANVVVSVLNDAIPPVALTATIPVTVPAAPPADTAAPIIEVTVPAVTTEATAQVTVVVRDAVNIAANGIIFDGAVVTVFAGREHVFTRTVNLREGMNVFSVSAQDVAGNVATRVIAIERRTPPAPVSHTIVIGRANPAIGLDVPANVRNGRLMVPFRWFGERILGATVDFRVVGAAEVVSLHLGNVHVELTLNSTIAKVNGTPVSLDVAAFATGGRTLVPARFLAETFGYTVNWNPIDDSVTITKR
ncbi:MAG: hypothetical protein KGZ50_09155 [Peptococcaceae bacterium]|nr:hypothetical protein [Peptococcaceae bacterium]